jgi:hypothetical protein
VGEGSLQRAGWGVNKVQTSTTPLDTTTLEGSRAFPQS